MSPVRTPEFQAGGTLRAGSLYVGRRADTVLLQELLAGHFCYVLGPRQIGKSSLRLRTEWRLREQGVTCIHLDLNLLGSEGVTPERWFYGLCRILGEQVGLNLEFKEFTARHEGCGPAHAWWLFLRKELLPRIEGPVVIFIDEIDGVLALPFPADDFFASIRALYNSRVDEPVWERLTFCILGLAAPGLLMKDEARTPFNVGRSIHLDDFTREEGAAFLPGLRAAHREPEALLDAVMAWTHGHPYMTQRLCSELVLRGPLDGPAPQLVTQLVSEVFLERGRVEDANLYYAEHYVSRHNARVPVMEMLFVYQRLLEGGSITFQPNDPVALHLRLSGLTAAREGEAGMRLELRNRIFTQVFDGAWLMEKQAELLFNEPLLRWLRAPLEKKDALLLRGAALDEALEWVRRRSSIHPQEEAFLRASQEAARREEEEKRAIQVSRANEAIKQQRVSEAQVRRIGRWLLLTLVMLLLVLEGSLLVHFKLQRDAAYQTAVKGLQELPWWGSRAAVLAGQPGRELEALLLSLDTAGRLPQVQELKRLEDVPDEVTRGVVSALMAFRPSGVLEGHGALVSAAAFSADGTRLASAGWDGTVRLWDARAGRLLRTLQGPEWLLVAVALSSDGRRLAAMGWDRRVWLWDAAQDTPPVLLSPEGGAVGVAFSPDGEQLLTASGDGPVMAWDSRSGAELRRWTHPLGELVSARFSPDGAWMVAVSKRGALEVWSRRDGSSRTLSGSVSGVRELAFSSDGARLATVQPDGATQLWSARDGKRLLTLRGHTDDVAAVAFSPDGLTVATASDDKTVRLWNALSGKPVAILKGHADIVTSVAFSPDGGQVVSASADRTLRLWSLGMSKPLVRLGGPSGEVTSVAFSETGGLVTASQSGTLQWWAADNGAPLALREPPQPPRKGWMLSMDGTQVGIANPDGSVLLEGGRDGGARLVLTGHSSPVTAMAFSPDGRLIATASSDGMVGLWLRNGQPLKMFKDASASGPISSMAISPDGEWMVTGGEDGTARLWSMKRASVSAVLRGHVDAVVSVALSPGTITPQVATASRDGTVMLWWAATGNLLSELLGHTAAVVSVAFSPDPRRAVVATASEDGTVRLWNSNNGSLLGVLPCDAPVRQVVFSQDGRRLAVVQQDGAVLVFPATLEGFLFQACWLVRSEEVWREVASTCLPYLERNPSWATGGEVLGEAEKLFR